MSFPHSNVGLTQVLWGETAECVCEGLADVFEFIGDLPKRAVFDNADGIGRRVGDEIRLKRALLPVLRPLWPLVLLHEPLFRQREGQCGEQGRHPLPEHVRAHAGRGRRGGLQQQAPSAEPRPLVGQAPLEEGHAAARPVRKGQGGPLGARAAEVLLQEVGDEEVQQARHVHARRHTALLRRPRLGGKGGGGLLQRLPCGDLRSEDGR